MSFGPLPGWHINCRGRFQWKRPDSMKPSYVRLAHSGALRRMASPQSTALGLLVIVAASPSGHGFAWVGRDAYIGNSRCAVAARNGAAYDSELRNRSDGEPHMNRADLTERILDIKREKGWTWKYICEQIGGLSPMLITGALLGQMKLTKPLAAKAAALFYRFYELVMINGPAWKALIEEEFGDGIMSAIDFDLEMERLPDPRGDRVKITMSGKFLPYKYYGATGNAPQYGYKEE